MRQFPTLTRGSGRGERRAWAATLGTSALLHLAALALLVTLEPRPASQRAGPPLLIFTALADDGGGGGGRPAPVDLPWGSLPSAPDVEAPALPPVPEIAPPPVPEPVPSVELALEAPFEEPVAASPPLPDPVPSLERAGGPPGLGGGSGGGAGSGEGSGTGAGAGVGTGGGAGDGIRPPAPLTILVPPAATDAVRGRAARVLLQVDSAGRVRSADVVVSSGDERYDEQLRRVALGWRFRPARDAANRPIPYPFEVSVSF